MNTKKKRYGEGIVAQVAGALGVPFRRWAIQNGFDDRTAEHAIRTWFYRRRNLRGYITQMVIRKMLSQLGHPIPPDQELPPPEVLKKILNKENTNEPQ